MIRQQYCKDGHYLPEFLKDFHDQKKVFKKLQQWKSALGDDPPNNWVDNHIYTIDYFLWIMALHGYKLQKIRAKDIEFLNIQDL